MYRFIILHALLMITSCALFGQAKVIKTNIYFDVNQAALDNAGVKALSKTLDSLCDADILKVILKGNADNAGADSEYNMLLSQKRADTVRNYMARTGVPVKVISESFFGEQKPIADNTTEEGRQLNRRVEVLISYQRKKPTVVDTSEVIEMLVKARKKGFPSLPDTAIARRDIFRCGYGWGNWCLGCGGVRSTDCWRIVRRTDSLTPPNNDSITLTVTDSVSVLDFGTFMLDTITNCYRDSAKCFTTPFYVYIPIAKNMLRVKDMLKSAAIYGQDSSGEWHLSSNAVDMTNRDGKDYLVLNIYCPYRWMSCRIINPSDATVDIKLPRGYTVRSFATVYDKPYLVTVATHTSGRTVHTGLIRLNAPAHFKAVLQDKSGKEMSMEIPLLSVVKAKALHGKLSKNSKAKKTVICKLRSRVIKAAIITAVK
ncbi:MAG: OmpA/MotB domain protein [Bacteroidetes bacterium]|nr:OmpA/MotB domain protein [Bacteroidota bacterium]